MSWADVWLLPCVCACVCVWLCVAVCCCLLTKGGFFAPHECAAWRAWAEKSGFKEVYEPPAKCVPRGVPREDNMFVVCPRFHEETPEIAHRNNGRMSWDDPVSA
mgnify:CR=1 FL=1